MMDTTQDNNSGNYVNRGMTAKMTKFPCLQYLAEFTGFENEFDYVRAYEIPPDISSIEWLNRSASLGAN